MNQSEIGKLHEKKRPQSLLKTEKGDYFKILEMDWKKLIPNRDW